MLIRADKTEIIILKICVPICLLRTPPKCTPCSPTRGEYNTIRVTSDFQTGEQEGGKYAVRNIHNGIVSIVSNL